jgi:hypothetical protein
MDVTIAASAFPPLALGFFGLGTGYLIYGPQELFGWPAKSEKVDMGTGVWGIWLPGFCQFVAGTILFLGLGLFPGTFADHTANGLASSSPLYMAAFAFSAYGIHWFGIGWNRYRGTDARANTGMTVGYTVISVMGVVVFFDVGDWPVGLVFVGLTAIYVCDFFASALTPGKTLHTWGLRGLGCFHLITGVWLLYCAFAAAVNMSLGFNWKL